MFCYFNRVPITTRSYILLPSAQIKITSPILTVVKMTQFSDEISFLFLFSLNNILFKYNKVQALQTRKHVYIASIHLKGIQVSQ